MRKTVLLLALIVAGVAAAITWLVVTGALVESVRVRIVDEAGRALGSEVTVSRLSGDLLRGLVLEGVRIAGPPGEATGSVFEAPRLTLRYDPRVLFRALLQGRSVISSISAVEIERPFLALARGADGHWNYADLVAHRGTSTSLAAFTARVEVREGTLALTDGLGLSEGPFSAHFERVTGELDFADAPLVRLALDAVNTDGRTPALLHISGRSAIGEETFDLDLSTRGGSVSHWGRYLVRLPWLVWAGGTFDGTMHLLASRWGEQVVLDYRGRLTILDGKAVVGPRKTALSEINGALAVDNIGLSTDGLALKVDASPLWVRGEITHLSGVELDLAVRSPSLDLATLQRMLFPGAGIRLGGRAGGDVRVVGPIDSPRLAGTIARATGRVNQQAFSNLSARFEYYGGRLVLGDVVTTAWGGQLHGYLSLDVHDNSFFALADASRLNTRTLPGFGIPIAQTLRGPVSGVMAASGVPGEVVAQGRVTVESGAAFGLGFDRLETIFGYDHGGVTVDRFEVHSGPSILHAAGAVTPSGQLDLDLVATDLNLTTVGARFGLGRALAGTVDVVGRMSGSPRAPLISGYLEAREGRLGPFPFDEGRGEIRISSTGLETPGMRFRDGQGRYEAVGLVRWVTPAQLDLTVSAEDVQAQRLLDIAKVPVSLSGTVRGDVRLSGPLVNPQAVGSVELKNGRVAGQHVDRARADFEWTGSELRLAHAVAEVNSSSVTVRGALDRDGRVALSFAAHDFNLKDVAALHTDFLQVGGLVDLSGTFGGSLSSPSVSTSVSSTTLALNGQRFDRAQGSARYQRGRLTLAPLTIEQASSIFRLSGSLLLRDDPVLDLRLTAEGARLSTLLGLTRIRPPFAVDGTIDGEFTAAGPLSNPRASLAFRLADGKVGDRPVREARIDAALEDHAVTLRTFTILPEQGQLVGAGRINLRGDSDVEFGGRELSLDLLRPLLGTTRPLAGNLEFTLQLSGKVTDPLIGLAASVSDGAVGGASFDHLTLQAFYQQGQLHIEQALLQEGRHKAKLEGTVPLDPLQLRFDESSQMNLRLALVDADLSLLTLLTDRVEQAEGPLVGEALITGTVAKPRMEGTITAGEGWVKLRGLDPQLSSLRAQLSFHEDEVRLSQFTAHLGNGTVTAEGTVGIRDFRPDRLNLTLSGDAARLSYVPLFTGAVDGTLHLGGTVAHPAIGGTLTLSGDLFVPPSGLPASEAELSGVDPVLDMELRAGDPLWVNVGGLRFQVHGAVHTVGSWHRPRLTGEVAADRGTFFAFNNTFTLQEGRATFAEFRGTIPFVDALAETRIRVARLIGSQTRLETATVFLHVQGTPDNLILELSSDPPLSRDEILAGLAQQIGIARLARGEDLERVLRAQLSQALFGSVGQAVARAFGLEEFTIEYDVDRPLQLRVGKLLIRNFYTTLTSEFGTSARHIWALEWRFTPNTMLSFSVDNQSRYDLLYRITYRF